jgi:hypothetical protein
MAVCLLHPAGERLVPQHVKASPAAFLQVMTPYRDDLVVAVACLFTWSWAADLGAREGSAFVLGPALSLSALHGGKARHDRVEAPNIAGLRRGGRRPQASGSPAALRATRDRLRRRGQLRRKRAELPTQIQNAQSQDNPPARGKKIADKANRRGGAARLADPAVHRSGAVDLAPLGHSAALLRDVELSSLKAAKPHNRNTRYLLRTVPGLGELLSLVRLEGDSREPARPAGAGFCLLLSSGQGRPSIRGQA